MKKILIISALVIPLICQAQKRSSFFGGGTIAYITEQRDVKWGLSFGLTHSFKISEKFDIEISAMYTNKGSDYIGTLYGFNKGMSIQLNCIEFPTFINYKYSRNIFGIGFGPCIAVQSRTKYRSEPTPPAVSAYWYKNIDNANSFDFPIYFKWQEIITIKGQKFYIQPIYSHGLLKQFGRTNSYTRTGYLVIGYYF